MMPPTLNERSLHGQALALIHLQDALRDLNRHGSPIYMRRVIASLIRDIDHVLGRPEGVVSDPDHGRHDAAQGHGACRAWYVDPGAGDSCTVVHLKDDPMPSERGPWPSVGTEGAKFGERHHQGEC
jgi:hypothetical protein